jgi:hypothetical protein
MKNMCDISGIDEEPSLFGTTNVWEAWHPQLCQDVEQGTELGKARLKEVQADEAGEPEPIGRMKMGQDERKNNECSRDHPDDSFNVEFFLHSVLRL